MSYEEAVSVLEKREEITFQESRALETLEEYKDIITFINKTSLADAIRLMQKFEKQDLQNL